jgi:hypothetical protein
MCRVQKNRPEPVESEVLFSDGFALGEPVGLAVLIQYQVGLYALIGFAFEQHHLILLQRLRHGPTKGGEVHRVFVPPGLHKRQVGVIQILSRVSWNNVGIPHVQPVGRTDLGQIPAEVHERVSFAFYFPRFVGV